MDSSAFQPWSENGEQIILVLVGLIASGKSTFAKALEAHLPEFYRCNQDDLGDRKAVERLARDTLRQGHSVCIDRTNFDETQRAHWINIAKEIPRAKTWCLIFDTPSYVCEERLQNRTDHPTIQTPEQGIQILHRFGNMYRPPTFSEGFDRIFFLKPRDQSLVYTREELQTILIQIETSPIIPATQPEIPDFFGPRPRGSGRGSVGRGYIQHRGGSRAAWNRGGSGRAGPRRGFIPHNNGARAIGSTRHGSTSWRSPTRDAMGQTPPVDAYVEGAEDGTASSPFTIG